MLLKLLGCTRTILKRTIMERVKFVNPHTPIIDNMVKRNCTNTSGLPGSGAGKGGGAGGSVKESGGGLGMYGTAKEEEYFYNKNKEKLEKMRKMLSRDLKENPDDKSKK